MQDLLTKHRVTAEQLAAVSQVEPAPGRKYWECESSTGDGYYTLRYHRTYAHILTCNCRAGMEGVSCWHVRAVNAYQERESEASPQAREQEARKADPEHYLERKPFNLLSA